MKKLLLSAAVLAFSAGAALAADLPTRKAPPMLLPPPPPPPLWTGFYAGLNAGYGFGISNTVNTGAFAYNELSAYGFQNGFHSTAIVPPDMVGLALSGVANTNQNGFIGGGQIGYNYQWNDKFVIGFETDIQGAGITGSGGAGGGTLAHYQNPSDHCCVTLDQTAVGNTVIRASLNWLGTVRGRVGYLVTPTMLVFGTGGFSYGGAQANANSTAFITNTGSWTRESNLTSGDYFSSQAIVGAGQASSVLVGWNAGGGLEWMFAPNWSVKAEAIYYDLGSLNLPSYGMAAAAAEFLAMGHHHIKVGAITSYALSRVPYNGVIARAGINYHFNWGAPAPVIAKY